MGVSRKVLIDEARYILGETLSMRGYVLEDQPPGGAEDLLAGRWLFSFEKKPIAPEKAFHIIRFTPRGPSEEDILDLVVELYRITYRDPFRPPPDGEMMLRAPLATYFLEKKDDLLQRWHFVDVEQLRTEYADILDRLLRYSIPLLENPNCTWEHWIGQKPLPHGEGYIIFDPTGRKKKE